MLDELSLEVRIDSVSDVKTESGYAGSFPDCWAYYTRRREAEITVLRVYESIGDFLIPKKTEEIYKSLRKVIYEVITEIPEDVDSGHDYLETIPLSDVKKGDEVRLVINVSNDFIENLKKAHTLFFRNKKYSKTSHWPSDKEKGYAITDNLKLFVKVT